MDIVKAKTKTGNMKINKKAGIVGGIIGGVIGASIGALSSLGLSLPERILAACIIGVVAGLISNIALRGI